LERFLQDYLPSSFSVDAACSWCGEEFGPQAEVQAFSQKEG